MRALSIRQPFAELILRGVKTVEYRSRPTRIVGERFWIYVPRKLSAVSPERSAETAKQIWSNDLAVPRPTGGKVGEPPDWLMELAEELILGKLPRGVIVGSAVVARCELLVPSGIQPTTGNPQLTTPRYAWHLTDVQRAKKMLKPTGHPQPVWYKPF